MKFHHALKVIAAALATVAIGAHAVSITYSFTTVGNHSGTFSFNDGASSNGAGPFQSGGTSYAAISFVVDGHSQAASDLVLYQNYFGNQFAYFTTTDGVSDYVQLAALGTGTFSSSSANQMDGKTLASFNGPASDNILDISGTAYKLTSLTQVTAVPEPETYALMLAGLAGLGVVMRRRRA